MSGLRPWKLAVYLAAIFAAGSVSGWVLATKTVKQKAFTAPRADEIATSFRKCMHSKLGLTDDQKQKIDAVIERSSKEIQTMHREGIERIRQAIGRRNTQIAAILTSAQQKEFEKLEKERQESSRGTNSWRGREPGGSGREHGKGSDRRKPSGEKRSPEGDTNSLLNPLPILNP